jgi:hypothetical protein
MEALMWRVVLRIAAAALISVPVAFVTGMSLTPLLWRLEPVLHMELAGHSGPRDSVLYALLAIVFGAVYGLLTLVTRTAKPKTG